MDLGPTMICWGYRFLSKQNRYDMIRFGQIVFVATVGLASLGCGAQQAAKNETPERTAKAVDSHDQADAESPPTESPTHRNSDDASPDDGFVRAEKTNNVSVNGIKIAYPSSLKDMQVSMVSDVLSLKFEEFLVQVNDGEVLVDGESFGRISPGDELSIGLKGEIAVNGQRVNRQRSDRD